MIDACRYADDAAARAAWRPTGDTAPAAATTLDGAPALRLPCRFAGTKGERASWDRAVRVDLAECRGVRFDLFCNDASPVSHFSLYFQSGGGWYAATFFPRSSGWNTVVIDKAGTRPEGAPAGWSQIRAIRISAWRGSDADTEFSLRDLRVTGLLGADAAVAIVRGDSAAQSRPDEASSVGQYTEAVARSLETLGIGYATLSDLDLTADRLAKAKLVILPHNPAMPDAAADVLVRYLDGGGKLLAFYGLHPKLRAAVQIAAGEYVKAEHPGQFAAMRFVRGALPGAPAVVKQRSWGIFEPRPVPGGSRILAAWLDDRGQPTGRAAVVGSRSGIEVSHVLLPDDPLRKRQMLLAMAGYLVPDLWRQATDGGIARVGQVGPYRGFDEAVGGIARAGRDDPRVRAALEDARRLRAAAADLRSQGRFPEACDRSAGAARRVMDAYCLAQRPLPGEFRAFWCHSAFGVEGRDWDAAIRQLAENGFTAVLPNMLWGGVAYYDSTVLPVAPEVAARGDQIAPCLAACRKYGLQVHVWKVNWNLGRAPQEFVDRMRREGRLQVSSGGREEPWLCPSHPDNQRLEIASLVEVARDYDIDGIHFDYIRYPDGDHCFCPGCRERFQRAAGTALRDWSRDVLAGGPLRQAWLDWRRDNITAVVKAVSEQVRALKPKMKLSAAVFRNWSVDRDTVGQDWKLWCEKGYLDFVCPMDYTDSDVQFENWVQRQKAWAGNTPCYPGIGASAAGSGLGPDQVIEQIRVTRRHRTTGFVIFNYGAAEAGELLPMLGKGITAAERRPGLARDRATFYPGPHKFDREVQAEAFDGLDRWLR